MIIEHPDMEQFETVLPKVQEGIVFLVDKPKNWTSFDVVKKLRWALKKRAGLKKLKVGHAGTLDPLATGLLIVCAGRATKVIHEYQGMPKTYVAKIKLGATTASYDAETKEENIKDVNHLHASSIYEAIQGFVGRIMQKPPIYSAIKKDGKKLYEHARAGEDVEIKAREVEIHAIELLDLNLPFIKLKLVCSKGTYVRSLAFDIGEALKVGGYLSELRRTAIGKYSVDHAYQIEALATEIFEDVN